MALQPAWAKNICRRVLWAALERDLVKGERAAMHRYFDGRCAYCGNKLGDKWHADHLVSVDKGGVNHPSNRVPACPKCNESEKREMDWLGFLKIKCGSAPYIFDERMNIIEEWTTSMKPQSPPVTEGQRAEWKRQVNIVSETIDEAWANLKASKGR